VLVLQGEDEEYLRKHDIAAPTPVHLQLEPVGALVLAVNADGTKRKQQAARQRDRAWRGLSDCTAESE